MKQLNIESTKVLNKMVIMAEDGYVKIDNSDGSFMSVILEVIFEDEKIKIISLAHYYLQEGDLLADPEMCFIYNKEQGVYWPSYFKQDSIGMEEESIEIEHGEIKSINLIVQKEHTIFANVWLKNIKYQQNL